MPTELTRDAFLALKRLLIVGDLREPSPFWLTLSRGPSLAFSGDGVEKRQGGCTIELGAVAAVGEHRRTLHVESLCEGAAVVTLLKSHAGLRASWKGIDDCAVELRRPGDAVDLDFVLRSELPQEQTFTGSLQLLASTQDGQTKTYLLEVRFRTRVDVPFGRFDFHGAVDPSPHNFGRLDASSSDRPAPYLLSVERIGPMPLWVALEDLPPWLAVETGDFTRRGPAPGRFFESEAPLTLAIRPVPSVKFLGAQICQLVLLTNDARERYRRTEIDLRVRIGSSRPAVCASDPGEVELVPPASKEVEVLLSNWGNTPARLRLAGKSPGLEAGPLPTVPAAVGDQAGHAVLQLSVSSLGFPPGYRVLGLDLRVEGGSPSEVGIRIHVHVLGITTEPARLDFGRVRAGEVKQLTLRAAADDGRALHLAASPQGEAAPFLTVSAQDSLVHVVCRGSALRFTWQGPGIEIRDPRIGLSRPIPVSFRSGAAVSPGMVFGILCALMVLLIAVLLSWRL